MTNPMEQISKHLTLLGEIGPARTKFTSELNNKISAINTAAENLGKMLEKIKELKKINASSNRNIESVRKGFEEEIIELKEEAKKGESKNQKTLQDIADKLSEYTNTLNEVKNATDNVDLTQLEENIRQLQEALGATVELPAQKSVASNTKSGWDAVRDNVEGSIEGTTGLVPGGKEELPDGWKSLVSNQEGTRGKTYYYREDDPEGSKTWDKPPTSGGKRKSRRNVNMRRKGGRRTRRRRTHRRTGGFRYDMSPQEEKRSRTLRSVKSLRSKSLKKTSKTRRTRNRGKKGTRRRRRKRRKR
tara:strand:+ start:1149 stop:2054 length:906 start_codon:yes stop_codon:yes gene_type:complete